MVNQAYIAALLRATYKLGAGAPRAESYMTAVAVHTGVCMERAGGVDDMLIS